MMKVTAYKKKRKKVRESLGRIIRRALNQKVIRIIYPKLLGNWEALHLVRHCRAACLLRK